MTTRKAQARLKSPPRRSCEGEVVAKPMDADSGDGAGRHRRIEQAAYLRAATRDFVGGDPVEDWLLAEAEIDAAEAAAKR